MKQRICFLNNDEGFPPFLKFKLSKNYYLTNDIDSLKDASVIFFHLPSLILKFSELLELSKEPGQVWIAWRYSFEINICSDINSVWDEVFDLYLEFSRDYMFKTYNKNSLEDNFSEIFRKVDFMIIGTQKGGSTALHEYLDQHPTCWGSCIKEPGFFLYPCVNEKGIFWYMNIWREKIPLKRIKTNNLLFESSTWYSFWHEVPRRLYEYNPNLKLIFLVRNPIERAFSQYNMLVNWSKEQLRYEYSLYPDKIKLENYIEKLLDTDNFPFSYWVDLEIKKISMYKQNDIFDFFPDFIKRGIYYEQISRYLNFYPKENILIIESNELKNRRVETLFKIEEFLNISHKNWEKSDLSEKFVANYKETMPISIRLKLRNFYKPYNEKFFSLIGTTYKWE